MLNHSHMFLVSVLLATPALASEGVNPASAAASAGGAKTATLDGAVAVGMVHDSSLNIVELDQTSEQGDNALLLTAELNGQWQLSENLSVRGGYRFTDKAFAQQSAFDTTIHHGSLEAKYQWGANSLGLNHHLADAQVDDAGLLRLGHSSLFAGRMLSPGVYLRGAATHQRKRFDVATERNADGYGVGADLFMFFNGVDTMWSLGGQMDNEDALNDELDHRGWQLTSRLSQQLPVWGLTTKLQGDLRIQHKDYQAVTQSIEAVREDRAYRAGVDWTVEFTSHFSLITRVQRQWTDSNFSPAELAKTEASLSLQARF